MNTCYIFGALPPQADNFDIDETDYVIAADGGFSYTRSLGINADLVIGDFDSLGHVPEEQNTAVYPIRKDDTDSMLALKHGLEKGYLKFVVFGCVGGRLDHTFANLQLLNYAASKGAYCYLRNGDECITAIKNGFIKFSPRESGTVSVFASNGKAEGVNIKGLLYETEDAVLNGDFPIGVSNEFIGKEAEISVKNGYLTLIFTGNETNTVRGDNND